MTEGRASAPPEAAAPAGEPGIVRRNGATLVCGLAAFTLVALLGGIGAILIIDRFSRAVDVGARNEVTAIGTAVAGALAHQFERAGNYGIPLDRLGGVPDYLAQSAEDVPGVARVVLRLATGEEVRPATEPADDDPTRETVFAPIFAGGGNLGQVEVLTDADELTGALDGIAPTALALVAALAVLAGIAAALLVGRPVDRRRAELLGHLRRNASGQLAPDAVPRLRGRGELVRAFRTLQAGEAHAFETRAAVEAYAEELLGIDFDGELRPRIEKTMRELG